MFSQSNAKVLLYMLSPHAQIFLSNQYTPSPSRAQDSRSIRKPHEDDGAKATRRICRAGISWGLGLVCHFFLLLKGQVETARSTLGQSRRWPPRILSTVD